jgi:hypothetical protein
MSAILYLPLHLPLPALFSPHFSLRNNKTTQSKTKQKQTKKQTKPKHPSPAIASASVCAVFAFISLCATAISLFCNAADTAAASRNTVAGSPDSAENKN